MTTPAFKTNSMCLVFHQNRRINNYTAPLPKKINKLYSLLLIFTKITKHNYFSNKNTIQRNIAQSKQYKNIKCNRDTFKGKNHQYKLSRRKKIFTYCNFPKFYRFKLPVCRLVISQELLYPNASMSFPPRTISRMNRSVVFNATEMTDAAVSLYENVSSQC